MSGVRKPATEKMRSILEVARRMRFLKRKKEVMAVGENSANELLVRIEEK